MTNLHASPLEFFTRFSQQASLLFRDAKFATEEEIKHTPFKLRWTVFFNNALSARTLFEVITNKMHKKSIPAQDDCCCSVEVLFSHIMTSFVLSRHEIILDRGVAIGKVVFKTYVLE